MHRKRKPDIWVILVVFIGFGILATSSAESGQVNAMAAKSAIELPG